MGVWVGWWDAHGNLFRTVPVRLMPDCRHQRSVPERHAGADSPVLSPCAACFVNVQIMRMTVQPFCRGRGRHGAEAPTAQKELRSVQCSCKHALLAPTRLLLALQTERVCRIRYR